MSLSARTNASAIDLLGIYEFARNNDPTYLAAGSAHEAALEQTAQARASLLPTLDGQASHSRSVTSLDAPGRPWRAFSTNAISLTLSQPVYRRDLVVALDQAKTRVAKADVDYASSLQGLMLRVATAYFNVLNSFDNLTFFSIGPPHGQVVAKTPGVQERLLHDDTQVGSQRTSVNLLEISFPACSSKWSGWISSAPCARRACPG